MPTSILVPGDSSPILVPPQGEDGPGGSSWEVINEWDFTALPIHTFAEGVSHTFPGGTVPWTAQNVATGDAGYPAVTASGLEVRLSSAVAENTWYWTVQTGVVVQTAVTDILPSYSPSDTIVVQCLIDFSVTTPGTNGGYFIAGLVTSDGGFGDPSTGIWNYMTGLANGSGNAYLSRCGGGSVPGAGIPQFGLATGVGAPAPSFLELVMYPGTGWAGLGSLDTEWQEPLTVTASRSYGNMEPTATASIAGNPGVAPSFALNPLNRSVGMVFAYITNGVRDSAATISVTQLRVLKRV